MPKSRRLRRLAPGEALFARRAAGESLRALAPDYGVHHTTLGRFFRRPEAVLELREARRRLQAERKARQAKKRRLEEDVRRRAREDEERDRRLEAWPPPDMPLRSGYLGWLDEREGPRWLSSRDRFSVSDDLAETVVAGGGGVEQVIDATGVRGRENVFRNIDAQIMRRALANDAKLPLKARPDDRGLRRLVPDYGLVSRRAAGETLRSIAAGYGVSHTTLSRYFTRPAVAKRLRAQQRAHRPTGGHEPQCPRNPVSAKARG